MIVVRWQQPPLVLLLILLVVGCKSWWGVLATSTNTNTNTSKAESFRRRLQQVFLDEKRQDAAVEALPSGLLIQRRHNGNGQFHPSLDTYCEVDTELSRLTLRWKNSNPTRTSGDDDEIGTHPTITTTSTLLQEAPEASQMIRPIDAATMPAIRQALLRMVEGDWWELYVVDDDNNNNDDDTASVLVVSLELVAVSRGDKIPKGEYHDCHIALVDDSPVGSVGCDERDSQYIAKIALWEPHRSPQVEAELARLKGMLGNKNRMKQPLARWVRRRIHLLKQFFLRDDMRVCRVHFGGDHPGHRYFHMHDDCNAQEQDYLWKVMQWNVAEVTTELRRLHRIITSHGFPGMDAALASWVHRRRRILKQILDATKGSADPEAAVPEDSFAEGAFDNNNNMDAAEEEVAEFQEVKLEEEGAQQATQEVFQEDHPTDNQSTYSSDGEL